MDARRGIPSVDRLLGSAPFAALLRELPRDMVVAGVQRELAGIRERLADGERAAPVDAAVIARRVAAGVHRLRQGSLTPVLNATGVVLHTNLGRAPLAAAAIEAMRRIAVGYSNLEYDLDTGARGSRYVHARDLLVHLTGAEDAVVVNNNAAALVLALNTLARGRDAIVSRGELVEIGGAFRVPEIMARSGARLREVGATNRTHLQDYRDALTADTGALLKVHPSNFTIEGYTAEVGLDGLAELARRHDVPLLHDLGSGLLLDPASVGLPAEPWAHGSLKQGADVVTMSGDKLLGGPQCGLLLGRHALLERMRRNPLCRALRVDKLTLAALEATLRLHLDPDTARREVPALRMLLLSTATLQHRAAAFAERCAAAGIDVTLRSGTSAVGGGASPATTLPTTLAVIAGDGAALAARLRRGTPAVIVRVIDGQGAIDLRTVAEPDEEALLQALVTAAGP